MNSLSHQINSQGICEIIFLNQNKNSFSPAAASELKSIIETAVNDKKVKALLFLSGNKKFFCAGGDLKFYSSLPDKKPGIEANKKISQVLNLLAEAPIPTAVCVNGLCIGGGVELISCFDYVVTGNASLFSLWQRKIGLSYGWSGGGKLLKRLDIKSLHRKFIDTCTISSYEALSLNLVDKIVPDFKLKSTAIDWLLRAGSLPKQPLELCKNNSIKNNEQSAFEDLWLQEDHKAALNKFNAKS